MHTPAHPRERFVLAIDMGSTSLKAAVVSNQGEVAATALRTITTELLAEYERESRPLPSPGLREVVVDSAGSPVAVIETTAARMMRLADVDLNHALGEGEGYTSVAAWRAAHERFWRSAEMRQALDDPMFTVGDDTLVVVQEFRLIQD